MAAVLERLSSTPGRIRSGRLSARIAVHPDEIEAAQRLRWRVFAQEMGAYIDGTPPGLDRDLFDRFCRHLLVEDEACGEIVGTYRVMLPDGARQAGGLYIENEFFTDRIRWIREQTVELGRSCVHPAYRNGVALMLLWSALGDLLSGRPYRYLIGCASVPTADGGAQAAGLWQRLWRDHAAAEQWRVFPKRRLPLERLIPDEKACVPPLLKGYLRAGAMVLGEPHHDLSFGCADLPMLLPLERLTARYSRRFIRS